MAASRAGETVVLKTGTTLGATVNGFTFGDAIEFAGVASAAGDTVSYASGVVSVVNNGTTVASFEVSGTYTSANFTLGASSGHLKVGFQGTPGPTFSALLVQSMASFEPSTAPEAQFGSVDSGQDTSVGGTGLGPSSPVDSWSKHPS
jgi:hypothetical protein